MTGWRSIDTAPRDGTPILVPRHLKSNDVKGYVPWDEIGVVIAWWAGPDDGWEMCFMEDGPADSGGYSFQFYMPIPEPDRWMPLPKP